MRMLNRLLLVVLVIALLGAVYGMHTNTTQITLCHDNFYHIKWPWLQEVRQVSIFGVLIWCLLFVRKEPLWVRFGLVALIFAFAIMALPPKSGNPADILQKIWH